MINVILDTNNKKKGGRTVTIKKETACSYLEAFGMYADSINIYKCPTSTRTEETKNAGLKLVKRLFKITNSVVSINNIADVACILGDTAVLKHLVVKYSAKSKSAMISCGRSDNVRALVWLLKHHNVSNSEVLSGCVSAITNDNNLYIFEILHNYYTYLSDKDIIGLLIFSCKHPNELIKRNLTNELRSRVDGVCGLTNVMYCRALVRCNRVSYIHPSWLSDITTAELTTLVADAMSDRDNVSRTTINFLVEELHKRK